MLIGVDMGIKEVVEESMKLIDNKSGLWSLLENIDQLMRFDGDGLKYRVPGFYEIYSFDEVFVFGDLHGDLATLTRIFNELSLMDKLEKEDVKLVFLGDYIDRGEKQLETILTLFILKTRYPSKVLLLRGNHEPTPMLEPSPHDFPLVLKLVFGEDDGRLIYRFFFKLFNRLPFGARIRDMILCLHGGPTVKVLRERSFEEAFSIGYPVVDDGVLEEVLWSDPFDGGGYEASYRGAGYLFGSSVTERALELAGVNYIVRGHEPVHGYRLDHGGRVVTVFSASNVYGTIRVGYVHVVRDDRQESLKNIVKIL